MVNIEFIRRQARTAAIAYGVIIFTIQLLAASGVGKAFKESLRRKLRTAAIAYGVIVFTIQLLAASGVGNLYVYWGFRKPPAEWCGP